MTKKAKPKTIQKKPAVKTKTPAIKKIISKGEPKPYVIENEKGGARIVVICDHASNRIPKALGTLGVSAKDRKKHIAWDVGTEHIGRYIAQKTGAVYIHASYSRLVVDLNRGEKSNECMREVYDHIQVPGNTGLSAQHKKMRLDEIYDPYHAAIDALVTKRKKGKRLPLIISIHSFTPKMDGQKRPWQIGVLWNREERLAQRLISTLIAHNPRLIVGRNEPYSLKAKNVVKNTISTHAEARGLPYITLEFRQDLVNTKAKAEKWARLLLQSLLPLMLELGV